MKKFLGIFDKRPLIWFHYVLLTIIVLITWYISIVGINFYTQLSWIQYAKDFLIFYLVISISDQFIHLILGVD